MHMLWMDYLLALKKPRGMIASRSSVVFLYSAILEAAILVRIDVYRFLNIVTRSSVFAPP